MKAKTLITSVLVSFSFFLLNSLSFAQWEWQYPQPTGNDLEDVCFVDDLNGWAVGEKGTIIYTSDGGVSWDYQNSGTTLRLRSVVFTDLQAGWIAGGETHPIPGDFIILHTTDGGNNWEIQNSDTTACLNSLFFTDSGIGWAAGENGTILYTNNGGADWISQWNGSPYTDFKEVFFVDSLNGWVAAEYGLYNTTNGGANWALIVDGDFLSVFFIDQNEGWASTRGFWYGTGKILHTTDNFTTWDTLMHCGGYEYSSCGYHSFYFKDAYNGWMLSYDCYSGGWGGGGCSEDLQKTEDGGISWQDVELPSHLSLNSLNFTEQGKGCIVGSHGIVLNTNNWSDQWDKSSQGNRLWLYSIVFPDMMNGWAAGGEGFSSWWGTAYGSVILHTSDGGATWEEQNSNISGPVLSVSFLDSNKGWAVGNSNDTAYIINTVNGGEEWLIQKWDTNYFLNAVHFTDNTYGCAVGGYIDGYGNSEGRVLKTNDGGNTWEQQYCDTCKTLNAVYFTDADHGWVVGSSIYNTTDGGQTWNQQFYDTNGYSFESVYFNDPQDGWIVGNDYWRGILLHTTDGGNTWSSELFNLNLYSVHFKGNDNGLISGRYGTILLTKDGGVNWEMQDSGTDNALFSICYAGDGVGYAAGEWGTIVQWDTVNLAVDELSDHITEIKLFNYPNPFSNSTTIQYQLERSSSVTIRVYNSRGQMIQEITRQYQSLGKQQVHWKTDNFPAGIYYCTLQAGKQFGSKKMIMVK